MDNGIKKRLCQQFAVESELGIVNRWADQAILTEYLRILIITVRFLTVHCTGRFHRSGVNNSYI